MSEKKDDYIFKEETELKPQKTQHWKVLIVDDDADIHDVTKIVLKNFEFENKNIQFISAYTIDEAKRKVIENPDIALILLDIVMEEEDSGLKFVRYLREDLKNNIVRIILRTGQPGSVPQTKVAIDYDINDYKEKTELTKDKFLSTVVIALRSFEKMKALNASIDELKSKSKSNNRFIQHDYLKILNKKNIDEIKLGDYTTQEMTVLFMNIGSLINQNLLSPQKDINLINTCIGYLDPVIIEQNGVFNSFIGEAIMSMFYGSPDNLINASIKVIQSLQLNHSNLNQAAPLIRIGIHSGLLTFGTVGSQDRMDYTAIGDAIHLAAVLENLNKYYQSTMLISEEAIQNLSDPKSFHFRWIGNYNKHDQNHPMRIYEIYDVDHESLIELKEKTKNLFELAIKEYTEHEYQSAGDKFKQVLEINSDDKIAQIYLNLVKQHKE